LIQREHAQIVHSNTMRASFVAALAARLARRPLIWHARDLYGSGQVGGRWYPRLMSLLADAVIANSGAVAATIPRRDVRVIYNGVELGQFRPGQDSLSARAVLGLPDCEWLIGTVGRMQPWKGHHLFLEAACRVSAQIPHAQFIIVGGRVFQADNDYEDRLRVQAASAGINDQVHFVGQQENVADWLSAMDIFVHCSKAEPFGRVVIEAMAAARPVVAFADGGVPEVVVDGETGRLVPPGNVGALADAIVDLARDHSLAQRLGQAGRRRAEALYSVEIHVRQIEAIYTELLSRRYQARPL
jgi:glycosyltransferase involved in cell wall biosynthesis